MKIGLFSDSHYCREEVLENSRMCSLSLEKIRAAMEYFKSSGVDLVMCLGDLADAGENVCENHQCLREIAEVIGAYDMPFLFVTGNHDFKAAEKSELHRLTGMPLPPYQRDIGEYRFICLDANYSSDMRHYDPLGFDWMDTNLPEEQLQFLQKALAETEKKCIVALHEPLHSAVEDCYRVNNAALVRTLLEQAPNLGLVIQGHMHEFSDDVENGVRYITVVGMCEGRSNRFMILTLGDRDIGIEMVTIP